MIKLSAAIIILNEEANLPRWLAAVQQVADEVVAVDSGSSDRSVRILEEAGARVEHRDWSGYADQRNFAHDLCQGGWILCLDADEVLDPAAIKTLKELKAAPPERYAAYELPSRLWFFGKWLRHGGLYPMWKVKLYHKAQGRWVRADVHERVEVSGPVGRLPDAFYDHYSYDSVDDYRSRRERYAAAGARHMLASGKKAGLLTGVGHAAWNFFHRYVLRLGFLDGRVGFLAAKLEAGYTLRKYALLADSRRERPA